MTKSATKTQSPEHELRHSSPSRLNTNSRSRLVAALNERLADGLDLVSQTKVAHWNIKGAHFAALHALFDDYASAIAAYNDALAERAVTLGGVAYGTTRHVAKHSHLPEYPQDTTRDLDHVRLLVERFDIYLEGLRATRTITEEEGDIDTADMLTEMITDTEKRGWFLRATLGD